MVGNSGISTFIVVVAAVLVGVNLFRPADASPTDKQVQALEARAAALEEKVGKLEQLVASAVTKPGAVGEVRATRFVVPDADGNAVVSLSPHGLHLGNHTIIDRNGVQTGALVIKTAKRENAVILVPNGMTFSETATVSLDAGGTFRVGSWPLAVDQERGGKTATWIGPGSVTLFGVKGQKLIDLSTNDGHHPWLVLRDNDFEGVVTIRCSEKGASVRVEGEEKK